MFNIIFIISLAITTPSQQSIPLNSQILAVMPKEVETPKFVEIKKSRGKGKGQSPWFAKYL